MLTIGFLGGMSWVSTAEYYRIANEIVAERLGGLHSVRCVLASVDFADIERMQVEGRWEDAGTALAGEARRLEAAGADFLVLCTNTMHKVADQITSTIGIPLLHLGDTTALAILATGVRTVGLLGTRFTMEEAFYRERMESHGLRVLTPDAADRDVVNRIIYDELCLDQVLDSSRDAYRGVIGKLEEAGAQGVILGCTEIELLITPDDVELPVYSTTRIHVEAAVDRALAG